MATSSHWDDLGLTVDQVIVPFPNQAMVFLSRLPAFVMKSRDLQCHPEQVPYSLRTAWINTALRAGFLPQKAFKGMLNISLYFLFERQLHKPGTAVQKGGQEGRRGGGFSCSLSGTRSQMCFFVHWTEQFGGCDSRSAHAGKGFCFLLFRPASRDDLL